MVRHEIAQAGYVESLTFALLSAQNNYVRMRQEVNHNECVRLSNPKTQEFEIVRTSLLPGLLMCLKENSALNVPQKLFEVSDTVVKCSETDTGAKNIRKVAAMVIDTSSNFEVIHGLLDLIMTKVGADFAKRDYVLAEDSTDPRFFGTRGFSVSLNGKKIGCIGVIHPEILHNFELKYPVSALEIDFDALFDHLKQSNSD